MRTRLIGIAALLAVAAAAPGRASAQDETPPPPGGEWGGDGSVGGELLGDGSGADVWAGDGEDLGPPRVEPRGGGNVVCRWYHSTLGIQVDVTQPPPPLVQEHIIDAGVPALYSRICEDSNTGELVSWQEDVALDLPVSQPVDPRDLALMARNRLPFPLPQVVFAPPLDGPGDFLLVQLPAWIRIENWEPESRSAAAGGVTATVTATPVRQEWNFDPRSADPALRGGCDARGSAWDPSAPADAQSTPCSFTFTRSSAGRPLPYRDAYEAHMTVVYEIAWTSNTGAGGTLGSVRRTAVVPVPVGEQQALNEAGGTQQ